MWEIKLLFCFSMDERIPIIHHSWFPADIVNVKNLTFLALLFAGLHFITPLRAHKQLFIFVEI